MKCPHCNFPVVPAGTECACRQAWRDCWAEVSPTKAYQIGVGDKAAKSCDNTLRFDVPPPGTDQFTEYMFGFNLRTSTAGLSPREILDRELSNV